MNSILRTSIPVQMISCTDTDGKITPMRFRFKNIDGSIVSVTIDKILKRENLTRLIGIKYQCTAIIYGIEKGFTLQYNYSMHEWKMIEISQQEV